MRSCWNRVGPHSVWLLSLHNEGAIMWRQRHRENATCWWRQRLEWCNCRPRNTKDRRNPPKLQESRKDFTQHLRGRAALSTPWFQTPGLQSHERINFFCFKPLSLFYFCYSGLRKLMQGLLSTLTLPGRLCYFQLTDESTGLREVEHLLNITQLVSPSRTGTWAVCYSSDLCFVSWLSKVCEVCEGNDQKWLNTIFEAEYIGIKC